MRRAVWGMFCADDAGNVSKSAEGLAQMMAVIVTVFEAAGLTVSEKKTETVFFEHQTTQPSSHRSSSKLQARGIYRQPSSYAQAVLAVSTKTLTSRSKSTDGSVSCGHASKGSARSCMIG